MKPGNTVALPSVQNNDPMHLRPIVLPSPPTKLAKGNWLKMKSGKRTSTKKTSAKHTPTPLPSISTLFQSSSSTDVTSSHSSSSNSSYGSYCQFSPEGTYTMYSMPISNEGFSSSTNSYSYNASLPNQYTQYTQYSQVSAATSVDEHKPVSEPLFIQTSFEYDPQPNASSYPTTSTINANKLLLCCKF